jgi:hypothetical protein
MFAVAPVRRLSIPITVCPRSSSVSLRCDPMKPAAPVMTILDIVYEAISYRLLSYSYQLSALSFQPNSGGAERHSRTRLTAES